MNIECGICFEPLRPSDVLLSTPCGHVFPQECLVEWLRRKQTCPQCRCYVTARTARPIYLNFHEEDLATIKNLKQTIFDLQRTLARKDSDLIASKSTIKTVMAKVESQNELVRQYSTECNQLKEKQYQLNSQLQSKTQDANITLEWLRVREEKIQHLEDSAKIDKEAYKVEIERLREQQDKLIEELTAKCSDLETSKRKLTTRCSDLETSKRELTAKCSDLETSKRTLEAELKKCVNEITTLQTSRAVKEKPMPSTELVSEEGENEIGTVQETRAIKEEPMHSTELESEKRDTEIATVQEARAVKDEAMPSTELESEKQDTEIATVQEARAVKEEPVPSIELESEKQENKIATGRKARVVKKEPGPPTKLPSKAKRAQRKVLSTIDSNTDTQAAGRKQRYFLRPR